MANENIGLEYEGLGTLQKPFETIGTISVQGITLAVTGRAWQDVKSYFSGTQTTYLGYVVPRNINAAEFCFQTTADADSHVVEIWGARGRGHFTLLATLTLTGGQQEADNSLFFVDTIVASTENLFRDGKEIDSATNRICRYAVDLDGYSHLLVLATTLETSAELAVQIGGW